MDDPTPNSPSPDALAARTANALRELQAHAQSVSSSRRERLSRIEAELTKRLDTIADAVAEQQAADGQMSANAARANEELAGLREQLELQEHTLEERTEKLAELERSLKAADTAIRDRAAELTEREDALLQRKQELDERQTQLQNANTSEQARQEADWKGQVEVLTSERDNLTKQFAELQNESQSSAELLSEAQMRLADFEKQISELKADRDASQSEWDKVRANLEKERDQVKRDLAAANEKCEASQQYSEAAAELDELKQKFALALDDVQRFRARATELSQELSERPEAGQADSSELVSLRAERDALAEKVAALEVTASAPASEIDQQQLADLQRRFELAVEDVRELKTKNSRLEAQVASSRKSSAGDSTGMDWESQKKRLLASLEGGDGAPEIEEHERTTIASTIEITDAVISEKDHEINELKAQLAARSDAQTSNDGVKEQALKELLDADDVIAEHRKNVAQLEQEMQAKLRSFEMEMSVDRARIARQKVELDQLRIHLEAERNSQGAGGAAGSGGTPKRRWLSKLGLGGDDTE